MNARYLFTLGVGAMVALVSGASLWRARTLMERELGVLTSQVDGLAAGWEEAGVPPGSRVATFVFSDTRALLAPFLPPAGEEGFADAAGAWIGRNLIGGNSVVPADAPLVRAFGDSTRLVSWTHRGFTAFGEAAMAREFEKALLKAHDAGAEINVVAQGTDAAAVLMALERVQGMERGGARVGANKVILVGLKAERLKRAAGKPANVVELAYLWAAPNPDGAMRLRMRLFDGSGEGETVDLEEAWPGIGDGGGAFEKRLAFIREAVESPMSLTRLLAEKSARTSGERAAKAAALAAEAAETAARAAAAEDEARKARARAARETKPAEREEKEAPGRPQAEIGLPQGWGTASLLDYELAEDQDTGWVFSAPAENLEDLAAHRRSASLRILKSPGVIAFCDQSLQISAFPAKELGPGDRDAAIQALFERFGGYLRPERRAGKPRLSMVHGHPAAAFETVGAPGEGTSYFVVETGRDLIYLVRRYYRSGETIIPACASGYRDAYQAMAKSIRPKTRRRRGR